MKKIFLLIFAFSLFSSGCGRIAYLIDSPVEPGTYPGTRIMASESADGIKELFSLEYYGDTLFSLFVDPPEFVGNLGRIPLLVLCIVSIPCDLVIDTLCIPMDIKAKNEADQWATSVKEERLKKQQTSWQQEKQDL